MYILAIAISHPICALFGTDQATLETVVQESPKYGWAFLIIILTDGTAIWFTIGIAEMITCVFAFIIMKNSEKNGIEFAKD